MSQVFVVVAAGSVLSFIIRELGEPANASWVIQVSHAQQICSVRKRLTLSRARS
jgi:hypothetical protein